MRDPRTRFVTITQNSVMYSACFLANGIFLLKYQNTRFIINRIIGSYSRTQFNMTHADFQSKLTDYFFECIVLKLLKL